MKQYRNNHDGFPEHGHDYGNQTEEWASCLNGWKPRIGRTLLMRP
jgi:hypothetical protein